MSAAPTLTSSPRAIAGCAALGVLGLAVTVVLGLHHIERTLISYLVAFAYWLGLSLGALAALLLFRATAAEWTAPVRRILEVLTLGVPLSAPLVLPLLIGMGALYPWARPGFGPTSAEDVFIVKGAYLAPWFFVARTCFYFAVWSAVVLALHAWSLRQDDHPDLSLSRRERALASVAAPVLLFTGTFAAYDWMMSVTPEWSSELYGVYYLSGDFLGALALFELVAIIAFRRNLLPAARVELHFHNLGKLLFSAVCFWGYIFYDQYLLMWIADLPDEVRFYIERSERAWLGVFLALIFAKFVFPFVALLSRSAKLRLGFVSVVCVWILGAHYLDMFWLIVPSSGDRLPRWTDLSAFVGLGGLFLAFAGWRFNSTPLTCNPVPELGAPAPVLVH